MIPIAIERQIPIAIGRKAATRNPVEALRYE